MRGNHRQVSELTKTVTLPGLGVEGGTLKRRSPVWAGESRGFLGGEREEVVIREGEDLEVCTPKLLRGRRARSVPS